MAPKKNAQNPVVAAPPAAPVAAPTTSTPVKPKPSSTSRQPEWQRVLNSIIDGYQNTPQRVKLIDVFMAFLIVVGVIQFAYCVLCSDYPFNSFISGFSVTVAQFVLTASLRIQTVEANKTNFPSVSPERAFADFVFCSFLAHFFAFNFIN